MKLKIFLWRSMSVLLMLGLTIISAALTLVMFKVCADANGQHTTFPWILFGDSLVPLMLFIPALVFRNKFFTLAAVLVSFFNIFLRILSIVVFRETYMPLNYDSLKLLLEHFDIYAMSAVLGKGFYWWLLPLIIIGASGIIYCGVLTWKTSGKNFRKISGKWLTVFSVLLGISIFSNLFYEIFKPGTAEHYLAVRPLALVSVDIANHTVKDFYREPVITPQPMPVDSHMILQKADVIQAIDTAAPLPESRFDKIIIIAIESLDLAFIRSKNPKMPEGITPNLDRFSVNYPSMNNYFTAAQPTSWGLNAIINSRLDYETDRKMRFRSIFSETRRCGYYSYYFSAASGFFGDNRLFYLKLFAPDDALFLEDLRKNYALETENEWGLSDKTLFNAVYQELKKNPRKKFIALISTMDTHNPYFHNDITDEEKKKFPTPFLQALHNTDRELGIFIDRIMADKELFDERSLIIITSDHSATHGENYLKRTNFLPDRIPLIFICRDNAIFKNLDTGKYASAIDLPPTILNLTGCQIPDCFMGRDLFSGKNIAVSRLFGNKLLLNSAEKQEIIALENIQDTQWSKAWADFYFSFYGK